MPLAPCPTTRRPLPPRCDSAPAEPSRLRRSPPAALRPVRSAAAVADALTWLLPPKRPVQAASLGPKSLQINAELALYRARGALFEARRCVRRARE